RGDDAPAKHVLNGASAFHCPSVKSPWFGNRQCNLVIVINDLFEKASFERLAGFVQEFDAAINAIVIADNPAEHLALPTRPTLIFSPALIRHRPSCNGRIFCGYPFSKSDEYAALEKAGIPVPQWTVVTEGETPDLCAFDEYVVRKPNFGGKGAA